MEFTYKDKDYLVVELYEPNSTRTHDIAAIYEIKYFKGGRPDVEITKEEYLQLGDYDDKYTDLIHVDYFYGVESNEEDLKNLAIKRLDFLHSKNV